MALISARTILGSSLVSQQGATDVASPNTARHDCHRFPWLSPREKKSRYLRFPAAEKIEHKLQAGFQQQTCKLGIAKALSARAKGASDCHGKRFRIACQAFESLWLGLGGGQKGSVVKTGGFGRWLGLGSLRTRPNWTWLEALKSCLRWSVFAGKFMRRYASEKVPGKAGGRKVCYQRCASNKAMKESL